MSLEEGGEGLEVLIACLAHQCGSQTSRAGGPSVGMHMRDPTAPNLQPAPPLTYHLAGRGEEDGAAVYALSLAWL